LYNYDKDIIHRNYYLEKEWKHIKLPEAGIKFRQTRSSEKDYLIISVDKPAFFLDAYSPGITFDDRGFIVLPGEEKVLQCTCRNDEVINSEKIKIFSLNDYLKD
jgi:hypothetical protein